MMRPLNWRSGLVRVLLCSLVFGAVVAGTSAWRNAQRDAPPGQMPGGAFMPPMPPAPPAKPRPDVLLGEVWFHGEAVVGGTATTRDVLYLWTYNLASDRFTVVDRGLEGMWHKYAVGRSEGLVLMIQLWEDDLKPSDEQEYIFHLWGPDIPRTRLMAVESQGGWADMVGAIRGTDFMVLRVAPPGAAEALVLWDMKEELTQKGSERRPRVAATPDAHGASVSPPFGLDNNWVVLQEEVGEEQAVYRLCTVEPFEALAEARLGATRRMTLVADNRAALRLDDSVLLTVEPGAEGPVLMHGPCGNEPWREAAVRDLWGEAGLTLGAQVFPSSDAPAPAGLSTFAVHRPGVTLWNTPAKGGLPFLQMGPEPSRWQFLWALLTKDPRILDVYGEFEQTIHAAWPGRDNLDEWCAASPTGSMDDLAAFTAAALDPTEQQAPPPMSPSIPSCSNDDCAGRNDIDLRNGPLPTTGLLTSSLSLDGAVLGSLDDIRFGSTIDAEASVLSSASFRVWQAEDSPLHGSRDRKDRFMHVYNRSMPFTITAEANQGYLEFPESGSLFDIEWRPIPSSGGIVEVPAGAGRRGLKGPAGSMVILMAVKKDPSVPGCTTWKAQDGLLPRWTFDGVTVVRMSDYWDGLQPGYFEPYLSSPPSGLTEVTMKHTRGGYVLAGQNYDSAATHSLTAFAYSLTASHGGTVHLRATPNSGWKFSHWKHDPNAGATCALTIDQTQVYDLEAVFERLNETQLSLRIVGDDPRCSGYLEMWGGKKYYLGEREDSNGDPVPAEHVCLVPHANPGYRFVGWKLDGVDEPPDGLYDPGLEQHLTVDMARFHKLDAEFTRAGVRKVTFEDDITINWDDETWQDDPFASDGQPIAPPHWQVLPSETIATKPACLVRQTSPSLRVELDMGECVTGGIVLKALLQIDQHQPLEYVKNCTLSGAPLTVTLDTQDELPNTLLHGTAKVDFSFSCNGGSTFADIGEAEIPDTFLIYGTPETNTTGFYDEPIADWTISLTPTVRRLALVFDQAEADLAGAPPSRKLLAKSFGSAIKAEFDKGPAHFGANGGGPIWRNLDPVNLVPWSAQDPDAVGIYRKLDCYSSKVLDAVALAMGGVPRNLLKTRNADEHCMAFPSTDGSQGARYNSNCTDQEQPDDYCNLGLFCAYTSSLGEHPDHPGPVYGTTVSTFPAPYDQWILGFAGWSAVENFMKVMDEDGEWYYVSVYPPNGPFLGSAVRGDEKDRGGCYEIMENSDAAGAGSQWWIRLNTMSELRTAADLP